MTKGHLIFAQNSDVDYVRQAYALAKTIKVHNNINQVCIVTNDTIKEEFKDVFDYIIKIPFEDYSKNSVWKVENRWQLIHASPFDETLVYDSDMLLLNTNDYLWQLLSKQDIAFTTSVKDYRGNLVKNNVLRKSINTNKLPNVYFGLHYFKKSKKAFEIYKWIEIITKNYKEFYSNFSPLNTQDWCSMDISTAVALHIIGDEYQYLNNRLSFVHMKKQIQGWQRIPVFWHKALLTNFTHTGQLFVANHLQSGLFHYTEDDFLTDDIIYTIKCL